MANIGKGTRRLLFGLSIFSLAFEPTSAWELVPNDHIARVRHLVARNAPITVPQGGQGFYFVTDESIEIPIPGCPSPTVTFFVPKADPADVTGAGRDNPAYRDSVDLLMFASIHNRRIQIYVDSCVNGYPRVVGLDIFGAF